MFKRNRKKCFTHSLSIKASVTNYVFGMKVFFSVFDSHFLRASFINYSYFAGIYHTVSCNIGQCLCIKHFRI